MNNKNEVYQSNHDIEKKTEFKNLKKEIENFLNEKLKNKIFRKPTFGKFKLKSMWFVIMKKNSTHDMHTHPKSAFTGVIYFKVNKNETSSALKVLIPNLNQNLYKMSHVNEEVLNKKTKLIDINNIETELYDKKIFNFVPDNKDMIIFNSYMMHGIDKYVSNEDQSHWLGMPFIQFKLWVKKSNKKFNQNESKFSSKLKIEDKKIITGSNSE